MKFKHVMLSLVPFIAIGPVSSAFLMQKTQKTDEAVAYEAVSDYGSFISSWSQKDHLYIHYNRGEKAKASDYNEYALWIWQHKPQDLDGSLWAFSGEHGNTLGLDAMTTGFMTGSNVHESGSNMWIDQYGAIIDVDLSITPRPGKGGSGSAALKGATEIGFLIVLESSMGGGHHWTSDCGKNTYLKNFDTHFDDNGSVHVYLNTGDFDNYVYDYQDVPGYVPNPVIDDTTGKYRSETETITDTYGVSKTAEAFK